MRISKRALFAQLGYAPHAGQELVHRSKASRRVLACGSRWGKTKCAAHEAVAALLEPNEGSIGWTVAPTLDLADRVFGLVVQILEARLPHRVRMVSQRDRRLMVTNLGGGTSELRGKSADRPASLLGEGLDWLVVDEAAQLTASVWERHLSQRLIDKRGWALLMSTPKGQGWFARLYRRGQSRRDVDFESWSFPSTANPHLDAAAVEAERTRLPPDTFAQEYLGEFVGVATEPCELCGGPSPEASGTLVIEGDAEPARCPVCEMCVDASGRTAVALWPDGSLRFEVIRERGYDWPFGVPDQLLSPEIIAADLAARLGPSIKPVYWLTPQEIEWAKAGLPIAEWPDS